MYKTLLSIFTLIVLYSNKSHGLDIFKIRSAVRNLTLEAVTDDTDGSYFLALKNDSSSKSQRWIFDLENAINGSGSILLKNLAHITLDFQVLEENLTVHKPTLGSWARSTWENFRPHPTGQNWKLKLIFAKRYQVVNDLSKRCLSVDSGENIITEICANYFNEMQVWKFENLMEDDDQIGWSKKWINLPIHQHFKNDIVSIYFGPELNQNITWINTFVNKTWRYCLDTYGNFGPSSRLFAVFHQGQELYGGSFGNIGLFYLDLYGNRNALDLYNSNWTEPTQENMDLILNKISIVVKNTIRGYQGNSQIDFLRDSWRNICIYDIYYRGLNMSMEAENFKTSVWNKTSGGNYWFADWHYKIYMLNENAMTKVAQILEENYPKRSLTSYESSFGEFVHFWSGVAGHNLQSEARKLRGWTNRTETEFQNARLKYPEIAY